MLWYALNTVNSYEQLQLTKNHGLFLDVVASLERVPGLVKDCLVDKLSSQARASDRPAQSTLSAWKSSVG